MASRENNANYMQHSLSCVWFDLVLGHTVSSGSPQFLLLFWRRNHNYPSVKDSNHNLISNIGIVYICTQCGWTYSWDNKRVRSSSGQSQNCVWLGTNRDKNDSLIIGNCKQVWRSGIDHFLSSVLFSRCLSSLKRRDMSRNARIGENGRNGN